MSVLHANPSDCRYGWAMRCADKASRPDRDVRVESLRFAAIGRGTSGNNLADAHSSVSNAADATGDFDLATIHYRAERLPDLEHFVDPLDPENAANPGLVSPDVLEVYENLVRTEVADSPRE